MTAFFVTGSGTDIGKTWVCAGLIGYWRAQGLRPSALKPVVTGFDPGSPGASDPAALLRALGRPADGAAIVAMAPFRFAAPLSPDQAAAREGRRLSAAEIALACRPVLRAARGPLLIEGAGGAMSPLNETETMLDLALAFAVPAIFVAGSYLGAITHALTGLHALRAGGVAVRLVLVNETPDSSVGLDETAASLAAHWPGGPILTLRRNAAGEAWSTIGAALGVAAAL